MPGPWEKYKSQSAEGPWTKYGGSPAPAKQEPSVTTPSVSPEAQVPGMFPYEEEKKIWDQANAQGLDYYQAKQKVLEARNKYTQSQKSGGIGENISGASGVVAGTALAPLGLAKQGVEASGESLQKKFPDSAIASGLGKALKFGAGAIPTTPLQVAGQAGVELAAPSLAEGANKLREPAKKVVGWFAQKFGGVASDTLKLLEDRAPEVVQYARQGYEAATKAATNAGKEIQGHIEQYAQKAGEEYRKAVESVIQKNPQYNNIRIDLQRTAGDAIQKIRDDFGFPDSSKRLSNLKIVDSAGVPVQAAQGAINRIGKSEADTNLFNEFVDQTKKLLTPTQAYYLQRDLSDAIRSNQGKPIAAALGQLKSQVINGFDASINGTPLGGINKGYRVAMTLAEDLSRVANSDNPLQVIKSAFSRDTNTADALGDLFSKSPQAKAAWEKAQVADAGAKISAWSRHVNPNTGASLLPAAAISGIVKTAGAGVPAALGAGALEFAATSPRLYGEGFNLLSKNVPSAASKSAALAALAALRQRNQ